MSDIPLCQFNRLTCAKYFQFGHNRKHKHFCVLYAMIGKISNLSSRIVLSCTYGLWNEVVTATVNSSD